MEKINLSELVGKIVLIKYPHGAYMGKITQDKIHGRSYYHLVYKAETEDKKFIRAIFLREENLRLSENKKLVSEKDFCPIWTHYKNSSDKEYVELEKILN